jgi:nucleoside-diphosphate-sugar epimerase
MIAAITGANGFIGGHLVRRFAAAGWEARPVVRSDFHTGAVEACFADADVVVHAAGATRAPSHAALRASNVDLTQSALSAAAAARVKRFVYVSSQAAAGPASSLDQPITELDVPAPVEAYGRSKLEAEGVVRASVAVPWVIVRPGAVYGPADRDFLALFKLATRRVAIHPANRAQWISVIHVDDLASGIIAASMATAAIRQTFFLANNHPVQWSDVFQLAARCAGTSLVLDLEVPQIMVTAGAAVGDLFARVTGNAPLLTTDKIALGKPPFWICSSKHAENILRFATPTVLQDGLCATYHWYLANHWL